MLVGIGKKVVYNFIYFIVIKICIILMMIGAEREVNAFIVE